MSIKNVFKKLLGNSLTGKRQIINASGHFLLVLPARDLAGYHKLKDPQRQNRASPT